MAPTSTICDLMNHKHSESEDEDHHPKISVKDTDGDAYKFGPLVVIFGGLPACGKTTLAHKLAVYLNWINKPSKVFSVSYCEQNQFDRSEIIRQNSLIDETLASVTDFLLVNSVTDSHVAIVDGRYWNSSIRQQVYEHFTERHHISVLFIECICCDEQLLEANVKEILQFKVDSKKIILNEAVQERMLCEKRHHEEITEAHYSYIKIFNAGESLSIHRIEGALQREVVKFLSCSVSSAPIAKTYYFSRHGESVNNQLGKIGGDTDLSARGQLYATSLARYFNRARIDGLHVWTSQKKRTKETVRDIEAPVQHLAALDELDAGVCEGLSYEEMQERYPQEFAWRDADKLRYRYPWGESYLDIMGRLTPLLLDLQQSDHNHLLVVSHQAVLRCIIGYFLNKRPEELPYINVPLHTIIKLTTYGYQYKMDVIRLNIECVDTYRQPHNQNCSGKRSADDEALKTKLPMLH